MTKSTSVDELEARHGERMIEVRVRFWTDNIAEERGRVVPGHAWASGVVRIARNQAHGISPQKPIPFNSLLDLTAIIEKTLIRNGIRLHTSRKMRRYLSDRK